MEKREHTFSWEALLRIALAGVVVLLLWRALSVLADILIALVLACALSPICYRLHKKTRVPFLIAIILVFIVLLAPVILLTFVFVPKLGIQLPSLFTSLTSVVSHLPFVPHSVADFDISQYIQGHLDYVSTTVNIALTVFSVIATVILTFYFIYDADRLSDLFLEIFPSKQKSKLKGLMDEVGNMTGKYIRGNILISLICGVVVFVVLFSLGVPFALPLALFAAVLDLLPLVGQTLGAIPAVIMAFGVSPLTGMLVIIVHLIYQQVENAIISPVIYNKALNLYPAVSFLSVLVGGSLFGILGAFLALPVAASVPVIIRFNQKHLKR